MSNIKTIMIAQLFLVALIAAPLAQACTDGDVISFSSVEEGVYEQDLEIDIPAEELLMEAPFPEDGLLVKPVEQNGYYEVDIEEGGYYNFE